MPLWPRLREKRVQRGRPYMGETNAGEVVLYCGWICCRNRVDLVCRRTVDHSNVGRRRCNSIVPPVARACALENNRNRWRSDGNATK